jgi:hypothetical protein
MSRPRISIGMLMTVVLILAADIAAGQALFGSNLQITKSTGTTSIDLSLVSLGILPMASLLLLGGIHGLPDLCRRGETSRFSVGFQVFGWVAVFLFCIVTVIAPATILGYANALAKPIAPTFRLWLNRAPEWAQMFVEVVFSAAVFTLPELIFALLGGMLNRKLGVTVVISRRRDDPRSSAVAERVVVVPGGVG